MASPAAARTPPPQPPPSPDVSHLLQRVSSLEQSLQQLLSSKKRVNSQQHLLHLEKQLETCSSPRMRTFERQQQQQQQKAYASTLQDRDVPSVFQMPLHYPRYRKADYETMPEWQLDRLLEEYGLPLRGDLAEKREFAIGSFLWKCQRG